MKFNLHKKQMQNVLKLIMPYWISEEWWKAWGLLIGTLSLSVGFVYISVVLNKWQAEFYNALQALNQPVFIEKCFSFIVIVCIMVAVFVANNYVISILSFQWRKWLTEKYTHRWLKNSMHYRLKLRGLGVDNPDQRISQDLSSFASDTLSLFIAFFKETISFVSFVIILWNLSGALTLALPRGMSLTIPGYIVWATLLYALIGTLLIIKIGKPIVKLDFEQEKFEANFRYQLMRLRENSEEVAIYKGAQLEEDNCHRLFDDIKNNFRRIIRRHIYINGYQNFYMNLATMFPILVAAPKFFSGAITLGVLMQIASAFREVKEALSILITSFKQIASLLATINRILSFSEAMDMVDHQSHPSNTSIQTLSHMNDNLRVDNLSLATPFEKALLENLALVVQKGEKLLIMGPNGSGKSTLLRAISGLWPFGTGSIYLPQNSKILVIPQKPYMPINTLRYCILYPGVDRSVSDTEMLEVLKECRLEHLHYGLSEFRNWGSELSLGEQQRIIFARILLHKPDWIIMDEPTASMDKETETLVYDALNRYLPNATLITIGHSHTLKAFHSSVIEINTLECA